MSAQCRVERVLDLPGGPRSGGEARRFVAGVLANGEVSEEIVQIALLLVSELVANAVLHAGPPMSVRCLVLEPDPTSGEGLAPGVLVEVSDGSTQLPRLRAHHREAVTGRGLELVALLAERSGVHATTGGKSVWFSLSGAAAPTEAGWSDLPAGADGPAVTVVLRGVPVSLYAVLQEHNESLVREFELSRLDADDAGRRRTRQDYSQQDIADAARARVQVATAVRAAAGVGTAGSSRTGGPTPRVDVTVRVPPGDVRAYERLLGVLDAAEAAAVAGRLLTRPALPELLDLRDWMFGQVVDQLHGGAPVPWAERTAVLPVSSAVPAEVDLGWVLRTPRAVVVADDANVIIAVSAAAGELLGWGPDNLVGRRITAIVPAHLREAHVTGFTRQLVTGRESLIGHEVSVPALHHDGQEIPVRLRLERVPAGRRTVYVGWLDLP